MKHGSVQEGMALEEPRVLYLAWKANGRRLAPMNLGGLKGPALSDTLPLTHLIVPLPGPSKQKPSHCPPTKHLLTTHGPTHLLPIHLSINSPNQASISPKSAFLLPIYPIIQPPIHPSIHHPSIIHPSSIHLSIIYP